MQSTTSNTPASTNGNSLPAYVYLDETAHPGVATEMLEDHTDSVQASHVAMNRSGAAHITAERVSLEQSGVTRLSTRSAQLDRSGALLLNADNAVLQESAGFAIKAKTSRLVNSKVLLLISDETSIEGTGSKALIHIGKSNGNAQFTGKSAAIAGGVFAGAMMLGSRLIHRMFGK